jgi:HPt (histidine-containing phosphotransfer) domain-containing protein
MDRPSLLALFDGNRRLLREMARLCLREDAPRLCAQLHAATQAADAPALESAAHALKGLVAEFRADEARAAAAALEACARAGNLAEAPAHIAAFEREFAKLASVLRTILDEPA